MRISEAARRLGTSPRMLRYRDLLGLLPPVRGTTPATIRVPSGLPRGHRRFGDDDLAAVAHELRIERRYDISPAALAFGLKVLTEPGVRADVGELGRRLRRIAPPAAPPGAGAAPSGRGGALGPLRSPAGGTSGAGPPPRARGG